MDDKLLIEKIKKKKRLAEFYFDNYKKYTELKKFSKASEFLWGVVNCLVTALSYLETGKASEKTGFVQQYIVDLTNIYGDRSIYDQFKIVYNIMHTNFYQNILDEEQFKENSTEVEKLINNLMSKLIENFEKKFGYFLD